MAAVPDKTFNLLGKARSCDSGMVGSGRHAVWSLTPGHVVTHVY